MALTRDFKEDHSGSCPARRALPPGAVHRSDQRLSGGRYDDGQGHLARSRQRDGGLRGSGEGDQQTQQEPASNACTARQPEHRNLLRHCWRPPEEDACQTVRDSEGCLKLAPEATCRNIGPKDTFETYGGTAQRAPCRPSRAAGASSACPRESSRRLRGRARRRYGHSIAREDPGGTLNRRRPASRVPAMVPPQPRIRSASRGPSCARSPRQIDSQREVQSFSGETG